MIPAFTCSQDEERVIIRIRADNSKIPADACSVDTTGRIFSFNAHPYLLRIVLPEMVLTDDSESAIELATSEGGAQSAFGLAVVVKLKKAVPGTHFAGLDTLHPLLSRPHTIPTAPSDESYSISPDARCACHVATGGKNSVQSHPLGTFGDIDAAVVFGASTHDVSCPCFNPSAVPLGAILQIEPSETVAAAAALSAEGEDEAFDLVHAAADLLDADGTVLRAMRVALPPSVSPAVRGTLPPPLRPQDAVTLSGAAARRGTATSPQHAVAPSGASAACTSGDDVSQRDPHGAAPAADAEPVASGLVAAPPAATRLMTTDEQRTALLAAVELVAAVIYEWRCFSDGTACDDAVLDEPSPEASYGLLTLPLSVARLIPPTTPTALVCRFVRRSLCFGLMRHRLLALRCLADAVGALACALPHPPPSSVKAAVAPVAVFESPTRVPLLTALAFARRVMVAGGSAVGRAGGLLCVAELVVDPLVRFVTSDAFPARAGGSDATMAWEVVAAVRAEAGVVATAPPARLDALLGLPMSDVADVAAAMAADGEASQADE